MQTIMVTGSTQGLGLQIATRLSETPDTRVILAVRDLKKGEEIAKRLGKNVSAVHLDLSSLRNVTQFLKSWHTQLDGLVNNAGVQFSKTEHFTADGFEETIAVNHLAAFLLTIGLEKYLAGGRVLFIGSGTHNPNHFPATMFGFRGAQFTSVQELAEGKSTAADPVQRNQDRYATSKFLCMVTAVELSRKNKPYRSYVLDPGLMPGTGLARTGSSTIQFLWKHVLPFARFFLPDTSSPKRSSFAASWILTQAELPFPDGTIFSYDQKPSKHV